VLKRTPSKFKALGRIPDVGDFIEESIFGCVIDYDNMTQAGALAILNPNYWNMNGYDFKVHFKVLSQNNLQNSNMNKKKRLNRGLKLKKCMK